jgi:tetratricopeptide (TPR) repeat protein
LGQRQQGVLDTLRLRDNEAIPLLRRALRDSEDDVRLLAYALLDRKEQAITARIRLRQKQLDGAEGDQRVGHHSAIAHDCWELIHLGLVQGEVMSYLLTTARKHVEDALLIRPRNAGLRLLLGKVLQRMGELALASESLRRAEELGIDSAIVGPELAAIAFSQQRLAGSRRDVAGFQPLTAG